MKTEQKVHSVHATLPFATLILVLGPVCACAHEEPVHEAITSSAFRSSPQARDFLSDLLGATASPFEVGPVLATRPTDYPRKSDSPMGWLSWGAHMEDDEDPTLFGEHFLRSSDHFYDLLHTPKALTDGSETYGKLPNHLTDSFTWATSPGMAGPDRVGVNAGPNNHTWQDARRLQYNALTLTAKADRDATLALSLYALGHVLHLNQDLSQPDHVRNDEHVPPSSTTPGGKHWIEDYGLAHYAARPEWFRLPPIERQGWPYWRNAGFTRLHDFWDRGLYTGASPGALDADAFNGPKLGLAEFSNGNFIGEDAVYPESLAAGDTFHNFPFPSRNTSTTYSEIKDRIVAGNLDDEDYADGIPHKAVYLRKFLHGVTVPHHSVLPYLITMTVGTQNSAAWRQFKEYAPHINSSRVLEDYHSILIPKAVEYSAGILDYFFRGQISVTTSMSSTTPGNVVLQIRNISGQAFQGGRFQLFSDNNAGERSPVTTFTTTYSGSLDDQAVTTGEFTPDDGTFNYFLVYQGSIGNTDPVDARIAVATSTVRLCTTPECWISTLQINKGSPEFTVASSTVIQQQDSLAYMQADCIAHAGDNVNCHGQDNTCWCLFGDLQLYQYVGANNNTVWACTYSANLNFAAVTLHPTQPWNGAPFTMVIASHDSRIQMSPSTVTIPTGFSGDIVLNLTQTGPFTTTTYSSVVGNCVPPNPNAYLNNRPLDTTPDLSVQP